MGRVYKAEFRHASVRLALSSGLSSERIAQDLGSALRRWSNGSVMRRSLTL